MSLLNNVLRSITEVAGIRIAYQPAANFSRNATGLLSTIPQQLLEKSSDNRYMIKEKPHANRFSTNLRKRILKENSYFLSKIGREKARCFAQIENIQKQCRKMRQNGVLVAQTTYNNEQPDLWKTVKAMYVYSGYR